MSHPAKFQINYPIITTYLGLITESFLDLSDQMPLVLCTHLARQSGTSIHVFTEQDPGWRGGGQGRRDLNPLHHNNDGRQRSGGETVFRLQLTLATLQQGKCWYHFLHRQQQQRCPAPRCVRWRRSYHSSKPHTMRNLLVMKSVTRQTPQTPSPCPLPTPRTRAPCLGVSWWPRGRGSSLSGDTGNPHTCQILLVRGPG